MKLQSAPRQSPLDKVKFVLSRAYFFYVPMFCAIVLIGTILYLNNVPAPLFLFHLLVSASIASALFIMIIAFIAARIGLNLHENKLCASLAYAGLMGWMAVFVLFAIILAAVRVVNFFSMFL